MENADVKSDKECVKVAVNVRPLITPELVNGCTDCISFVSGESQVQIGSHAFTFDHVFGNGATPCARIFDDCIVPLIDALFRGYNGTVLAYGQTGSGKTYTMGTNYNGQEMNGGVIPKVMEMIFYRVKSMKSSTEFLIRVSFIEIFKEEVFDLLDSSQPTTSKAEVVCSTKSTGPVRVPIQIRETANGGITMTGVTEAEVTSKEEMGSYLTRGSIARATASTNMNSQSSRSHAIFTISMEQKKIAQCPLGSNDDADDILSAKLHLVDLAGSERAKRTGADGMRLKEGIHINKGLLSLGNVISALGDEKKRKEGGHVPYRDSKLTRLLQDSLGGNCKTVMIACVSPADTNAEETLNTLKYANRARNIQNKAVINRDPVAAQMQRMRSQIEQLQSELLYYRGDSSVSYEELEILKHKISLLEASNAELQRELQERRISCEHFSQRAIEAQVEKDKLIMKLEAVRAGKSWDEIESLGDQEIDLVKTYVSKIQELEGELILLQNSKSMKSGGFPDAFSVDDEFLPSKISRFACLNEDSSISDANGIAGDDVDGKELEQSSLQEQLDMELKELDRKLEQKEAEMKRFANGDTSVLKQHYEKRVLELEHEKKVFQNEIEDLRNKLSHISSTSDTGAQKLKDEYLQKLNLLESQVSDLKKKQEAQTQLLRQKQKSEEAARRLQDEIQRIKSQKVSLQNKIKQESEQFRLWKASREKEVLQLKKEGRRNEYEMHKLLALNQRQKMVLQRKAEEAAVATKRLKDVLQARKVASREASGNANVPGVQALMQGIEHELEVIERVHEVRSQYERQMEERAKMAHEIARLKEEAQMLRHNNSSEQSEIMSPGARNSRVFALENMLSSSSSTLVSMASQLSEAEERERAFNGRGRWNHVRSLAEAKNVMNYLFNLASSSRCIIRDKEIDCKEKDSEIKELKEKVVKLSRQAKKNGELLHQIQKNTVESRFRSELDGEGRTYDLRQGPRTSGFFKFAGNEVLVDMDTSESDHSERENDSEDDEWVYPKNSRKGGRLRSNSNSFEMDENQNIRSEGSAETITRRKEELKPVVCCTCTKKSFCKTLRCECRDSRGFCSASCGCSFSKCSNREENVLKTEVGDDIAVANPEVASRENGDLASQGAALLESALSKMPSQQQLTTEKESQRKPLADIGNTAAKSNAPRPKKQKNWRKTRVQLVPTAPPPSSQSEYVDHSEKKPESTASEANNPLKLLKAMKSNNSNPLRDMNSEQGEEESSLNKDYSDPAQMGKKRSDQKENHGH